MSLFQLIPPSGHFCDKPAKTVPSKQAQLGQFLTPKRVADFMAGMFDRFSLTDIHLMDAGAGAGALTRAFVDRWRQECEQECLLTVSAYEVDSEISQTLLQTLKDVSKAPRVSAQLVQADFIERAATMCVLGRGERYSHAILNPPYKKISNLSAERKFLRAAGIETVNLYSGFVGLSLSLLKQCGEMVAIIPRSFCNGPYYRPFRHFILERASIKRIHLFDSRHATFKADGVLQENVIIHMQKGVPQGEVIISTSTDDSFDDLKMRTVPFSEIVSPDDEECFIHIPSGVAQPLLQSSVLVYTLDDLGVKVSTGPVVDFRMGGQLVKNPTQDTVPLLYPGHFVDGKIIWPKSGFKKPNAIKSNTITDKWLFPTGFYTVVKRFSSKEEKRRISANVIDPVFLPFPKIGFENHLNVFHDNRSPLLENLARGLAIYLNSSIVDVYFRQFNGHTQVNATDLRAMRYPEKTRLCELGDWSLQQRDSITQDMVDQRVESLL